MQQPFDPPLTRDEISSLFPQIEEITPLTTGGEGSIFTGINNHQKVALKFYGPNRVEKRVELEVDKLKRVSCPFIVSLVDYGKITLRQKDCLFIITNFIQGRTLVDINASKELLTSKEVAHLIRCIGTAIHHLWNLGVVHCDITPKNIIKKNDKNYVLIDLGIAKHIDTVTITEPGIIFGTMGYIAPEQIKGRRNLTLRADFYSLGIVSYQCLTGYHPFNYQQELMLKNKVPLLPESVRVNKSLEELIYIMCNPIAYKRPSSFKEIMQFLEGVL